MFRHVLFCVCAVSLFQIIFGSSIDYRCAANGCLNGAECQSNGQCKCSSTQYGTYCDTGKACAGSVTCTSNAITATNQCYVDDDTQCICKDGFTNVDCGLKILDVTCGSSDLTIKIRPHRYSDLLTFSGDIYFANDPSKFDDLDSINPACKKSSPGPYVGATSTIASSCGAVPTSTLKYYAYIKHNRNIKSVEDQIIEITCGSGSQTSVSITNTVIGPTNEIQKTTVSKVDDVTMRVRKDGGKTLSDFQVHDTVRVNDHIALTLESSTNFLIRSCTVTDGESTPAEIPLIKDWCVANEGLLVYSSKIITFTSGTGTPSAHGLGTGNAVKLPLKVVKFTSGSKMMFTCDLCFSTACTSISPPYSACTTNLHIGDNLKTYHGTMSGSIPKSRRRRRNTVTNGAVSTSISVSVTVEEYKDLLKEANESKETECFKSAVVLLPLILLASLLVIAMGMTFFFCNKFTTNMTEGQGNFGFKA